MLLKPKPGNDAATEIKIPTRNRTPLFQLVANHFYGNTRVTNSNHYNTNKLIQIRWYYSSTWLCRCSLAGKLADQLLLDTSVAPLRMFYSSAKFEVLTPMMTKIQAFQNVTW